MAKRIKNTKTPDLFNDLFFKENARFTFIDLFAGIGGTRIAFENVGGVCVFSSEWDPHCQKTYAANFGEIPHGDITKVKIEDIPAFDILVAGFPCQPFSTIGKREGFYHKTQGTLFYNIAKIIDHRKPKAFLLENVPGLKTHDNGKTYDIIISSLKKLGYQVFDEILDSADFNVPQVRKRIYIVGFNKKEIKKFVCFKFPTGSKRKAYINKYLEKNIDGYSISEHLQKTYLFKKNDGRPQIVDKDSKIQVKTLVSTYHKIQRLTGTFVKDGKTGVRLLTANECKAIMGFSKKFKIPVSRTQMYRQMGNSVVVPVVKAIALSVVEVLETNKLIKKKK